MLDVREGEEICESGGDHSEALDICEAVNEESRWGVRERRRETCGWRYGRRSGVEECERLIGVLPGEEGVLVIAECGESARAYYIPLVLFPEEAKNK
jgi:hypothetical protein